ncbi:MAG: prolyl oligopeptidase family serine peptidase [Chloroflexota bacterium]|nr:prolyl oligopeptidase family serine peptidase [Chloroflexota bacterium]
MSRHLSIDDLLRIRYPTESVPRRLSPDGRFLALTVAPALASREPGTPGQFDTRNVPATVLGSEITVIDTSDGSQWQPFPDAEVSWGGQWSPDGSMLAAYVVMGGPACLGILHLADRRVRLIRNALVRPYFGFELPVWTPDSRLVVAKLWPADEAFLSDRQDTAAEASSSGIVVFAHDPGVRRDDATPVWMIAAVYGCDFGTVDIRTHEVHRLAENWNIIGGWRMSPDGTSVAVPVIVEEDAARQQFISDLMVVPLNGAEPRAVAQGVVFNYGQSFSWSPDGERIAFTTADQPHAAGQRPPGRLFVADAEGRRQPHFLSSDIGDDLRQAFGHPRWSATGDQVFCLVTDGVWSVRTDGSGARKIDLDEAKSLTSWIQPPDDQVMRIQADGSLPLLLRDTTSQALELVSIDGSDGSSTPPTVLHKRYVARGETLGLAVDWRSQMAYLQLEAAEHPPEVWQLDLTTADVSRQATINPSLQDHSFGSTRLVEFLDADGDQRQASLLLPPDYVVGNRVPMIVIVYGGIVGSQRIHSFGLRPCLCLADACLYASLGYAVLLPDIHLGPRNPRRGIPRSVVPAVDRVVELGFADPERIGVLGHSYGGYSVLSLISQTEMFSAAVSSAGTVNLTSFYGALSDAGDTTWIGWCESGQARLGGSLWENRDAYIENSSLFYLDRVTTPLLMFSGDDDTGAFAQASEAFSALRRLGQRVELRNYKGEDHWPGSWSEPNLRDVLDRTIAWFDEHLKPDTSSAG